MMNELFKERSSKYFGEDAERFLQLLSEKSSDSFFLNQKKAGRKEIFDLIDFPYEACAYSDESFYYHHDNIGKSKAYELGLIYPQDIAASLTTSFIRKDNIRLVVDMCAAPGGKTINAINRLPDDVTFIANDISHARAMALSSNLERLGLDNVIITSKQPSELSSQLEGIADVVILDAPCSGEGMIRKYPQILEDYSLKNIENLAAVQKGLLEEAYQMLKENGQLLYSTCTYAFEEDEDQVSAFLESHSDMKLLPLDLKSSAVLPGTVKLSPLNNTEGQFIALMVKNGKTEDRKLKLLDTVNDKTVDEFIRNNLKIDEYFLYRHKDRFYLSLKPLPDLKNNIFKYGIYLGDIINKRLEVNHNLYRANSLKGSYRHVYDLNDQEYDLFISGNEITADLKNGYYQMTYHNHSLGYGRCADKRIKNKYPKGLRRMI